MKFSASLSLLAALLPIVSAGVLERRAWSLPPVNGVFDYQLGGAYAPESNVQIVTRDSGAAALAGKYNICYVNGFQTQPQDKSFWETNYPNLLLRRADGQVSQPGTLNESDLLKTGYRRTAVRGSGVAWRILVVSLIVMRSSSGY